MAMEHPSRRELLRQLALGATAALAAPPLAILVGACAGSSRAWPRTGGTVSFAITGEPQVLNPAIHTLAVESMVISLIFPGLLGFDASGNFVNELAESCRIQDGGLTYRFTLRPGLSWQDGRPLTSRDVQFTYQTYVDPQTKTTYLTGWDRVERVDVPDDATVVFRMKEVFAPFLSSVGTSAILPRHVLAGIGDVRHDPFNRSPVGAGPFKLASWDAGSQIVLDANERYWRGRPRLDRFVFKVVPDAVTQVSQLETGEVDIVSVPPALWDRVRSMAPAIATAAYDDTRYALVQLDEYDFLTDVRVRQALDYATPKADIVKGLLHGLASPAVADVPPGSPYYDDTVERHDYNLGQARRLLAQAGFTTRDGVMTRDGRRLEVPIYTVSNQPTYIQVAQVLKDRWSSIGVATDVTTMETATLFSDRGPQWNGKDAALIFSWTQGTEPYNYVNWSSRQIPNNETDPGENVERYVNPVVDDLVVKGGQVTDIGLRKQVYRQLQRILAHDVPVIFLYWPKTLYAYRAGLRGFRPNAFSGTFGDLWSWTKG